MSLLEKLFFSKSAIVHYGKKALNWYKKLDCDAERKITLVDRKHVVVKAEVVKDTLTYTIHVRVREGDMFLWKYRKYSIYGNELLAHYTDTIALNPEYRIVPGRTGKYAFKQ